MNQIILANQAFIPSEYLSEEDLKRWRYEWTEKIVEEAVDDLGNLIKKSNGKPVLSTRMENRVLRTFETVYGREREYVAIPRGDLTKLEPFLKKHPVVDLRSRNPLGIDLELADHVLNDKLDRWNRYQKSCVDAFLKKGSGIILGKTGSGKTIMGLGAIVGSGMKTLILSKRRDGNTMWEAEIRKHTNISILEEALGTQLVGVFSSKKKKTWPVTIATVQSFLKTGHKHLISLQNEFGLVLVDEVHELGSREFSRILSCFNPLMFCGLTATLERKDHAHFLLTDVVGPVVAEADANQMPPIVTFISTGEEIPGWIYEKKYPRHFQWNKALQHLSGSDSRFDVIINWLHKDIEDGRTIACVADRRAFPKKVFAILREQGYSVEYVDGSTKKREAIYDRMRNKESQVLCAGKVLNALVNIPSLDCIHVLSPLNNKTGVEQLYGRGRRVVEGKRLPLIRDYVDAGGQMDGAFKNRLRVATENGWDVQLIGVSGFTATSSQGASGSRGIRLRTKKK